MDNKTDRRFAQTLARGLLVLKAFRPDDGPLGNQELSERTGIPKSTISRLTFTLSVMGFLEHLSSYEKYRLGPAAMSLGSIANATIPFMEAASEIMQAFVREAGTMVGMTMRDGDRMLITHCWRPVDVPSIWLNVGFKLPLFTTSSGLTYLSSLPSSVSKGLVDEYLTKDDGDAAEILDKVNTGRQSLQSMGFCVSDGSWNPSINAVAVPFRSSSFNEPVVFFSGAPADMVSQEKLRMDIGPKLAENVRRIELF